MTTKILAGNESKTSGSIRDCLMGSRSKGGYKSLENKLWAAEQTPPRRFPKILVVSKFRKRTRKYRRMR